MVLLIKNNQTGIMNVHTETSVKINFAKGIEIIDPQQTEHSLDMILDAIQLLNQNGLQLTPEDQSGHYSGGYNHVNSMYVTSPMGFQQLIRKANDVLYKNDMEHLRIIKA